MYDIISKQEIIKNITKTSPVVYVFDSIDSTNRFAKSLTDEFALVVANSQTHGRGRLDRVFFSPADSGIYMSLKVPVQSLYSFVPFITTLSAVGVHRAVNELLGINLSVKWVNDLYKDGKKVAGILCEVCDDSHVVIGIGINFYASSVPKELEDIATHITDCAVQVTRSELIGAICDNISSMIFALPDTSFMDYYKQHSCVIGKKVKCIQSDSFFVATALDIDSNGALVVLADDGIKTLSSGEISIRFTD